MKNLILLMLATFLIMSCNQNKKPANKQEISDKAGMKCDSCKDGVFIHITESYNNPHKVLMPLKMANMMAMDNDVLVYMDIKAVELLVKGAKDMNYADFQSCQTLLKSLIAKKVGVYACPTCLKIAGFKPENLMEGVQIAQKDKFFNFTKGRIITLDY
jgi:predicted peroxiredoxin